jgi:hypothetical protein
MPLQPSWRSALSSALHAPVTDGAVADPDEARQRQEGEEQAAAQQQEEVVEVEMEEEEEEEKEEPHAADITTAQIHWAVVHARDDLVVDLFRRAGGAGADPDTRDRSSGWGAVHWAARHGRPALVSVLLGPSCGLQIELKGTIAANAATHSCAHRFLICFASTESGGRWWLGADVEQRTPLHVAAMHGQAEAAAALLHCGAQEAAQDRGGATPLHWAAAQGHAAVVRLVLAAARRCGARGGAAPEAERRDGEGCAAAAATTTLSVYDR